MKVFDIKVYENFNVIFRLVLCKTQREMVKAYNKQRGQIDVSGFSGIFTATDYVTRDDMPGEFKSNVFGTMWLNLENLSDKVIIHECGHAAFSFERNIMRYTGNFNDKENNEIHAYGDEEEVYCCFLESTFIKVKQAIMEYIKSTKKLNRK
jgi:hypothetical protein